MENQNQSLKTQLIERLKQANNVLVTVSRNPSVDQVSAAIGLTLMLNHLDKHATAVFSGEVPNTLEFLKPEETLEKTTDSLRDFIISLDKSKADKLRYKVENKMVKIFITPYRTSLTEADLVFGQGDFNVDVVVALGVKEKEDLDEAIISHGRILHDATVATLNTTNSGQLGSINWVDTKASSLSEMLVPVCEGLKAGALDAQMATAFLTGIVAETNRFSNEKTSSDTMNISSKLMAAGANQQLVATKLEESSPTRTDEGGEQPQEIQISEDGSLDIAHNQTESSDQNETTDLPEVQPDHMSETEPEDTGHESETGEVENEDKPSRLVLEPPTMGGKLTANTEPEGLDPSTDPLTLPSEKSPILTHEKPEVEEQQEEPNDENPQLAPTEPEQETQDEPVEAPEPDVEPQNEPVLQPPTPEESPTEAPKEPEMPATDDTLADIETAVDSPHVADGMIENHEVQNQGELPDADAALAAAHEAFDAAASDVPEKPAAFNSSGLMDVSHADSTPETPADTPPLEPEPVSVQIDPATGMMSYPTNLVPPSEELPADPTAAQVNDPTAPPEVPPPMTMMPPVMPPQGPPSGEQVDPNNLPPIPQ